jgi:hypothetical protein
MGDRFGPQSVATDLFAAAVARIKVAPGQRVRRAIMAAPITLEIFTDYV